MALHIRVDTQQGAVRLWGQSQPRFCGSDGELCLCIEPGRPPVGGLQVIEELTGAAGMRSVGLAYPRQVGEDGVAQDFERALPTPWGCCVGIFRRGDWRGLNG